MNTSEAHAEKGQKVTVSVAAHTELNSTAASQ